MMQKNPNHLQYAPLNKRNKRPYNWKGGKTIMSGYPYVLAPSHPNAQKHGYIAKHRFVMSEHLGRPLKASEIVHHIDKNPMNSDIDNLKLVTKNTHRHHHKRLKPIVCDGCGITFQPIRAKTLKHKYCSWECWITTPRHEPRPCNHCGKSYVPIRKKTKFCSKKCANKNRRKRVNVICDHCGITYFPRLIKKEGERKYCSRSCYIAARFH